MRHNQLCPKCQSRKLWVVDDICMVRMTVVVAEGAAVDWPLKVGGKVEAWVCAQCGFTEYYATDANEHLRALAARSAGVRYVDVSGNRGPFR